MYTTAEAISAAVMGDERLYAPDGILAGRDDTPENHPYLDSQIVVAMRIVDSFLAKGGYTVPLTEPVDPIIESATIGVTVGLATESMSNREKWIDDMRNSAYAWLEQIAEGGMSPGSDVEEAESPLVASRFDEPAVFDTSDPWAGANIVFGDMGGNPFRRGRW